jgi:hypothetical protein
MLGPRDAKLLLRHVVRPFLLFAPREESRLEPLGSALEAAYGTACQMVAQAWLAKDQRLEEGVLGQGNSADLTRDQQEVLDNKLLVDLSEELLSHLDQLVQDSLAQEGSGSKGSGMDEAVEDRAIQLGPAAMFLLGRPAVANGIIYVLGTLLACSNSQLSKRTAAIFQRLIPALAPFAAFVDLLAPAVPGMAAAVLAHLASLTTVACRAHRRWFPTCCRRSLCTGSISSAFQRSWGWPGKPGAAGCHVPLASKPSSEGTGNG